MMESVRDFELIESLSSSCPEGEIRAFFQYVYEWDWDGKIMVYLTVHVRSIYIEPIVLTRMTRKIGAIEWQGELRMGNSHSS